MRTGREEIAHLLSHYFRTVFRAAGLRWDSDNDAEMGAIADAVVEIAKAEVSEHWRTDPHHSEVVPA